MSFSPGPVTAEIIEASDGKLQAGDLTGLSGIQRSHDDELRGRPGGVVQTRRDSADGAIGEPRELHRQEAVNGTDIQTSIDPGVQSAAEDSLAAVEPASALLWRSAGFSSPATRSRASTRTRQRSS